MKWNSGTELLITDRMGIYIPQIFAEVCEHWDVDNSLMETLAEGPEHIEYWDCWEEILATASFVDGSGFEWKLWWNGDLWAYCEAMMTDEECDDFFN